MASAWVHESLKALEAVPSKFNNANDYTALACDSLPSVDFSALISDDPHQRSKAIQDLAAACRDWGFFHRKSKLLVNHGIAKRLMKDAIAAVREFFDLPDCEKKQYESKLVLDSIQCGNLTLANTSNQSVTFWREYLRLRVHPDFHCPHHLRFKSLKHRAAVNKERERISLVVLNAPAWDAIVGPAAPLVEKDGSPLYHSMEYKQYLESSIAQSRLGGKSLFEQQLIIQDI
ncbi:flavonol synthase/flavanone 3-hydroxylase-like [Salvia splendens]|uniref:flavonol synthase/flavanone 3-hydroxylase-like n=1 Tax=Salvia splendens TaxID=180675 RepID=UPI001C255FAA|nr:flavonol synthase/flavanone 3-hydroxylase-like [Salvia splendens]